MFQEAHSYQAKPRPCGSEMLVRLIPPVAAILSARRHFLYAWADMVVKHDRQGGPRRVVVGPRTHE